MKIWAHVHFNNLQKFTGHGRVTRCQIDELRLRSEVELTLFGNHSEQEKLHYEDPSILRNHRYHTYSQSDKLISKLWLLGLNVGLPDLNASSVVYSTFQTFIPTRGVPLFIQWHDVGLMEKGIHSPSFSTRRRRIAFQALAFKAVRSSATVVTISKFSAGRIAHFFPELTKKIEVVPHGVSQRFLLPTDEAGEKILITHGLQNRPYIVVPGGLHERKNAALILSAAAKLSQLVPDLIIVIAGHNDIKMKLAAEKSEGKFVFLGYVTDGELVSLYKGAICCWFPSRYEGFGLPIIESMASSCPVVSTNCSAIPEVAGDAAILGPCDDEKFHLDAILTLYRGDNARFELITKGIKRAGMFSWSRSADKLIDLFSRKCQDAQ